MKESSFVESERAQNKIQNLWNKVGLSEFKAVYSESDSSIRILFHLLSVPASPRQEVSLSFNAFFSFLSIGRESTTWSANNCLQITVCSCVVPSKHILLQIIFCSFVIGTTSQEKNGRSHPWAVRKWLKYENNLGDRMIKQLLNSVITKYHDLPVSRRSIFCLSLRLRHVIDLLATDKSRYFAQPRPIIVKY